MKILLISHLDALDAWMNSLESQIIPCLSVYNVQGQEEAADIV